MAENVHKVFSEIGDEVSFYGLDEAHQIWRKVTAEEPSFGDGDRLGDSPEFPLWWRRRVKWSTQSAWRYTREILDVGTKRKLGDKAKEDVGSKARKITQGNLKNSQDSTSDEDELGSVPEQITEPLKNEQVEEFDLVNRFPDIEAIGEEAEYEDNAV